MKFLNWILQYKMRQIGWIYPKKDIYIINKTSMSAELTLSQLKQFLPVIYSWLSKYTQQHTADFTQQLNNWSPHLLKRAIIVRYHFLVLGSIGSCNTEGDYCIKNKQTKPSIFLVILHDHAHHRRHDFFWQNSFGYRNTSLFIRWGH
jgi:hypothetical protein